MSSVMTLSVVTASTTAMLNCLCLQSLMLLLEILIIKTAFTFGLLQTLHPPLIITQIHVFGLNINSIIRTELLSGIAGGERRFLLPPAVLTAKQGLWSAAIKSVEEVWQQNKCSLFLASLSFQCSKNSLTDFSCFLSYTKLNC